MAELLAANGNPLSNSSFETSEQRLLVPQTSTINLRPPAYADGVILFPEGLITYPEGTERGLYPVENQKGKIEYLAPNWVVERDIRLLMQGLKLLLPPVDMVIPIAKGGLVLGQEAGYMITTRSDTGRVIGHINSAQTNGYDEFDNALTDVEIWSTPQQADMKGMKNFLFADDLRDKDKAVRAVSGNVVPNMPEGANWFETALYAKENGIPVSGIVLRMLADKWVRYENQMESDEQRIWYMRQLFNTHPKYFEHMEANERSKAEPLPPIPDHWHDLIKARNEHFAFAA
ncbi:MAG: hypothetical protein JWO47_21 [Candidatus Saccharibacteria bacterium]|nr:hypothetical protein [Candidatus Saccharibacteria bacterium]